MSRHIGQGGDQRGAPGDAWFQVDHVAGCAVVHAGGEIDARTVHPFHDAVTQAASRSSHVVIDMTQVTFVDSSGLGALILARRLATDGGGSMSLVSPPPVVRRLLSSTYLHDVFAVHDSVPEAIAAVTQRGFRTDSPRGGG